MSKTKLLKGITKARQRLMTEAQKARAKKTQDTAGPSSRRDMKDAVKPKKEPSFRQRQKDKKNKQKAKEAGLIAAAAIPGGIFMGQGLNKMSEPRIKLGDKVRKARDEAEFKGEKTFQVGGVTYNTKTGRRVTPVKKANGGLADEKKGSRTRSLTGIPERRTARNAKRIAEGKEPITSLTGIPERRREANKRRKEQGLEPITSLTGIPERRKDNKKKKSKTPVKKASGGLASAAKTVAGKTTRSRNKTKPRGVGVAMRGYGKALK